MKYISFIDQLGIDLEQLSSIDSNRIIKLQKQLKAKAMLGDANNLGEVSNLIENLKDEETLNFHILVEQHKWLKQLITGDYKSIKQSEINFDKSQISNIEDFKYFLAPFLKDNLKVFLSESLSKGKYVLLLKVLTHNYLFSEENNQLIISFFRARLNYAAVYLRENRLKNKEYPIAFITNKVFINCLNEYPNGFNNEIQELNSEVIDIYNSKRKNVNNQEFRFSAKTMVALSILDTSNVFLEDTLVSNAEIARAYTYPSRSSTKTGSGFGGWSIFVIIMIVIRILFWIGKESNRSTSSYRSDPMNWVENFNKNNISELSNIITVYPRISQNKPTVDQDFKLYDNPYSSKFNKFYPPKSKDDISRFDTYVTNKTGKDLILFMLYKNDDKAVYIPKNKKASLQISAKDTIVFYSGNKFVNFSNSSKFFKDDPHMSKFYIIDSLQFYKEHFIDVYKEEVYEIISDSIKNSKRKSDSIHFKNIFFKTTTLQNVKYKEVLKMIKIN